MNRTTTLLLAGALLAGLTGCAGEGASPSQQAALTPEARTQLYRTAIESARDQELNDAFAVVTSPEDPLADVILPLLGVEPEDMTAYAISASPMITKAYGVAAIYPAPGREERVLEGLNAFMDQQKQNFEQYLPDQYDIARSARLETLDDGTVLLAMCENQDAVLQSVRETIQQGG